MRRSLVAIVGIVIVVLAIVVMVAMRSHHGKIVATEVSKAKEEGRKICSAYLIKCKDINNSYKSRALDEQYMSRMVSDISSWKNSLEGSEWKRKQVEERLNNNDAFNTWERSARKNQEEFSNNLNLKEIAMCDNLKNLSIHPEFCSMVSSMLSTHSIGSIPEQSNDKTVLKQATELVASLFFFEISNPIGWAAIGATITYNISDTAFTSLFVDNAKSRQAIIDGVCNKIEAVQKEQKKSADEAISKFNDDIDAIARTALSNKK